MTITSPVAAADAAGAVVETVAVHETRLQSALHYCVAKSSPNAPRRALGLANVTRLVDEAVELGFDQVFFTGGEPFILNDIYDMLAYSSARVTTTVLTNAMLVRGSRLERLSAIANPNLIVQVSLDGGRLEHHDAYRGAGSWEKTVAGIRLLQAAGFRVRLGTTETPPTPHLDCLCQFHQSLGIPEADHFVATGPAQPSKRASN
jgi:MoaA/NifB/PqqE/SkfB family radical SAM enzyme